VNSLTGLNSTHDSRTIDIFHHLIPKNEPFRSFTYRTPLRLHPLTQLLIKDATVTQLYSSVSIPDFWTQINMLLSVHLYYMWSQKLVSISRHTVSYVVPPSMPKVIVAYHFTELRICFNPRRFVLTIQGRFFFNFGQWLSNLRLIMRECFPKWDNLVAIQRNSQSKSYV
jgi:hypothetical protein